MKTLFSNGEILTMNDEMPFAEVLLVCDDKIAYVGSKEGLPKEEQEKWEKIDLKGKAILPGFIDSHMHLLGFGETLRQCKLSSIKSIVHMQEKIKDYAASTEEIWVQGRGWNQEDFLEQRLPCAQDIDKVIKDKPVVLKRTCGHMLLCNTKAMEIAKKIGSLEDVSGGQIDRDEKGNPTGIFRENAMDIIFNAIPSPSLDSLKESIIAAGKYALSCGVTSVQTDDLCVHPQEMSGEIFSALEELDKEGQLPVRVYEQALFRTVENLEHFIKKGYQTGRGSDFFTHGPLKILSDGSLGARTAFMSVPYADGDTKGLFLYKKEQIDKLISQAQKNGISSAVHAIGDGAIDWVLDSMEKAQKKYPNPNLRNSIIHCQITREDHFERMRSLDILAHIQPIFIENDMDIVEERIGAKRAKDTYAWGRLLRSGVHLAIGTDCPVESIDVIDNLHAAVNRQKRDKTPTGGWHPEDKLTLKEALKGVTTWAAYAACEEGKKGKLENGYLADLVVLNKNPLKIEEKDIQTLEVLQTWVGGKMVYQYTEF